MKDIEFRWDKSKDRANQKKHNVSFNEAKTVFYEDNARLIHDPDHSDSEERYIILGISSTLRLLVVSHTYDEQNEIIRLISARKATKNEIQYYIRKK